MGFFARLKWLFVGEGEAPSNFKQSAQIPSRRAEGGYTSRNSSDHRDRNRDRGSRERGDNRDSRGGRFNSREHREGQQEGRERGSRSGNSYGREGREGGERDRYNQRDRGSRRGGSHGGAHSRREFGNNEGGFPRQIERPTGGPSSTMRPAHSSVQEIAPAQTARVESTGPEKIGSVSQYFEQARIANLKIEKGFLRPGDWIEIQGNISALRQKVDSIQLDGQAISEAVEGQEVGIRVIRPVKVGDAIVRLRG